MMIQIRALHLIRSASRLLPCILLLAISKAAIADERNNSRPNVLFVILDDQRSTIGCFGDPLAKTPNLDALAKDGVRFQRAYVQMSLCAPSRSSFFSGRRPDTTRVFDFTPQALRKNLRSATLLPEAFKNAGYITHGIGKVYDRGDVPESWTEPLAETSSPLSWKKPRPWNLDLPDADFQDHTRTDLAIETMKRFGEKPFFLAVGYKASHFSNFAPRRFWEMNPGPYDYTKMGITEKSRNNLGELDYCGFKKPLTDQDLEDIVRGYYATSSFIDFEIGRLIQALDDQKIRQRTIVVIFGDNGFHLGENGSWAKKTNFEIGARVPLMICGAGVKAKGQASKALVELVDLYPTLVEMAGIDSPDKAQLEGTSMFPLLSQPEQPWKKAAFTQFETKEYAIRTAEYRLIAGRKGDGELEARALYHEESDPQELNNLVNDPGKSSVVQTLLQQLKEGWKAALPEQSPGRQSLTLRDTAEQILTELRLLDAAKDQAALELKLVSGTVVSPATLRPYIRPDHRLFIALSAPEGPKDLLGHPYSTFKVGTPPRVSPATVSDLKSAVPKDFWRKYAPKE